MNGRRQGAFTATHANTGATALLELNQELGNETARAPTPLPSSSGTSSAWRTSGAGLVARCIPFAKGHPRPPSRSRRAIPCRASGRRPFRRQKPSSDFHRFTAKDAPSLRALNTEIPSRERRVAREQANLGKVPASARYARGALAGACLTRSNWWRIGGLADEAGLPVLSSSQSARAALDHARRSPRRSLLRVTVFTMALLRWALAVLIVSAIRHHGH
jgi:hypothetical protein